MRPRSRFVLAIAVTVVGGLTTAASGSGVVGPAAQPAQAARGPGSNGSCRVVSTSFDNADAPGNRIYVFQPEGGGVATIGGGRCGDHKRPAVFMAHGLGGTDPSSYLGLIDHLVSVGNVVVYPTYNVTSGDKSALEAAYRYMNAGDVEAARRVKRIDTSRVGYWGHSFGASMVPYLVLQAGHRHWGTHGLWMNNIAMTFALLVGPDAIPIPRDTQVLTVGFDDDALADNRIGDEVFGALAVPTSHKRHALIETDPHGQPALLAEHNTPIATAGPPNAPDAFDFDLWRDMDLLELCAVKHRACHADYSAMGTWSDGTAIVPALVAQRPVDAGPYPALLAECDGLYGRLLNAQRIHRCGPTHV